MTQQSTAVGRRTRYGFLLWFGPAVLLTIGAVYSSQYFWRENGLRALQAINEQRVQLVANAVRAEIGRQDHLPLVLSLDPDVINTLVSPQVDGRLGKLNQKLKRISQEADTRALYVTDPNGRVVASDDFDRSETLLGRNVATRPYFIGAVANGRSSFLGVDRGTNLVRYYLAHSVSDDVLRGVAVVRVEFDGIESAWAHAGERVMVTDPDGIVFLASDPTYKYRSLKKDATGVRFDSTPPAARYPDSRSSPLEMTASEQRGRDQIVNIRTADDDASYLYQSMVLPEFGWTIHRLTDLSTIQSDQRDGGIIGGTICILLISLLLYWVQRHRAYVHARAAGDRLKWEVGERTRELREVNDSLHLEIDERRRTEARLHATQNDLVQAGKLAALGQMSAALAHEINQPLAAIRTFIACTKVFAMRGEALPVVQNLDLINGLAERMAKLTSHLKTFARKSEPGKREPVAIDRAVEGALFLIEGQIKSAGATIEKRVAPDLFVRGYAVQVEQVMVNLVRNALDAMKGVEQPKIIVTVEADRHTVKIVVADTGPGFAPGVIGQIFDPFFTTKVVGEGLGLGLSISYGIVQEFNGQIHAANRPEGGAEMTVELPRLMSEDLMRAEAIHA